MASSRPHSHLGTYELPMQAVNFCKLAAPMLAHLISVCTCRFPIFLTMAHLTIGFFVLSPIMTLPYYSKQHAPTLKAQWKGIACVGSFKVNLPLLSHGHMVST